MWMNIIKSITRLEIKIFKKNIYLSEFFSFLLVCFCFLFSIFLFVCLASVAGLAFFFKSVSPSYGLNFAVPEIHLVKP